ncbi:MAG: heme ABC exporter ATP-binding protein CcmA [Neomegalonema sp.]|nr:heme ABC exporter ATP-binding protein CcmA [Neomegalonema sp.]
MKLEAHAISCIRGGRRVFSRISFAIEAGEVLILRGPNGAGKSSLLRCLSGLVPLAGGSVTLSGLSEEVLDLSDDRETMQSQLAAIGHLDAVKPGFTVAENLRFWARIWGENDNAEARVAAALTRFGLDHIAQGLAAHCSAGQKRRLGLARLSVAARPIWLLDEPTVSLDAASVAVFADLVRAHCAKGGMAIAATHIDLGLEAARELVLEAAPRGVQMDEASDDPFLDEGAWI